MALERHREQEDRFYAEHLHSPLPQDHREGFDGLRYFEPDPDLRYVLPLHPDEGRESFYHLAGRIPGTPPSRIAGNLIPVASQLISMQTWISSLTDEASFLCLLAVLVAGPLLYFQLSPGSILTDIPEIAFMPGLVGGFIIFALLIRFHHGSTLLKNQLAHFGWRGAVVGGIVGIWLATHQLAQGLSIIQAYDEVLIVLDVGIVAGALVGISSSAAQPSGAREADEREYLLAESSWTNQLEPNPIVVEIVEQLAEIEGVDPLDLDPLSTHLNLDVFEELRAEGGSPWQLLFEIDEYEIRVNSYGTVTVYDGQQIAEGPLSPRFYPTNG